ncbi:MAG: hypothetical protein NTZ74_07100 [Chloroflexi bacterium]|nr:hypothetical protein [Chloroflexota bacterium]
MLLFSILIYFLFTCLVCISFFQKTTPSKFLQIFFLIVFASNILLFEILSFFTAADRPLIFLTVQLVFFGLSSFLILKKHPVQLLELKPQLTSFFFGLKKVDYVLISFIGVILAAFFIVGITTPPNNLDSFDPSHLPRIYYWIQNGTLQSINSTHFSDLIKPINAHIQGFWLFSLGRSENLFFLVQWFSLVIITASIYDIARSLKFASTPSLVSAIVGLSFPVALLQSYSSQGDLTVAALPLISISWAMAFINRKNKVDLIGAILAFCLALGTKNAAFLIAPVMGLYVAFWLMVNKKIKQFLPWFGVVLAILLVFSGFQFVQNMIKTGSVFGIKQIITEPLPAEQIAIKAKYNFPRYIYQFIGFDGLPKPIQEKLTAIKARVFENIFVPRGIDLEKEVYLLAGFNEGERFNFNATPVLSEDTSWFGPIGLIIPFGLLFSFLSAKNQIKKYALFAFLIFLSFFFLVFLQRQGWDPYQGRYFLIVVLPLVPLISILIPNQKVFANIAITLIVRINASIFE